MNLNKLISNYSFLSDKKSELISIDLFFGLAI